MRAGPVTVRHLLENRQRFCVPIYQRHYVWTRDKQWEPFWNDVRTKAIERLAGRERRFSHFMGAVVLESRSAASSRRVTSFQVVDGQQRLTTFQLFLAAVRDYAKRRKFTEIAERMDGFIFNDRPHLMEDQEVEIYKVWPTEHDRDLFKDIMKLSRENLKKKYEQHFYAYKDKIYKYSTVPNLLGAYGFFFDHIMHAVESDELEDDFAEVDENEDIAGPTDLQTMEIRLDAIWEALVEEFKVVEILLDEGDDAQIIFETLNERGEPLLAADLVRNNIFHRADTNNENAEKLFSVHWAPFEDPFWSEMEKKGRYKKPRIEFFISNFISGRIASEVTISKLFSEYKAFLKYLETTPSGGYPLVEDEINDLANYGTIYRDLLERSEINPLGRFTHQLHVWDVTTVFPLVLRLWANDDLEDEEKEASLPVLLSFIVRRAICNLTTKNYNKFFLSVVRHLDSMGWSRNQLIKYLTSQKSETARFPTDEEFHRSWLSLPMYNNLQPSKIRYVLEELEKVKRNKYQETDKLGINLSVEHILPRDWKAHWPLAVGIEPTKEEFYYALYYRAEDDSTIGHIVRRNRLKHTIGNLTLLTQPLNSSISNGPFEAKREALLEHSLLVLNREIAKNEVWDEQHIEERSEELFSIAQQVWPYPYNKSPDI